MCRSSVSASTRLIAPSPEPGDVNQVDREIARRLREARAQSSFTISELAEAIRVSNATYQAIERGDARISSLDLARLAMTHALPIAWFFESLPGQFIFNRHPADIHKE